jgi:hypothetical protein
VAPYEGSRSKEFDGDRSPEGLVFFRDEVFVLVERCLVLRKSQGHLSGHGNFVLEALTAAMWSYS